MDQLRKVRGSTPIKVYRRADEAADELRIEDGRYSISEGEEDTAVLGSGQNFSIGRFADL